MEVLEVDGKPAFAILPFNEYQRLLDDQEELNDIKESKRILETQEVVPSEIANALIDGENPVKVWRKHRGLSQKALAQTVGISAAYLSQIEAGERDGSLQILKKIAAELNVDLDDLD